MAEARCGQEQSMRDVRDSGGGRRHPRRPNAPAERNKPDQQPSSQGALSSIRAAIMRTSRSTAQEQHRERRRRRPQITILSAEPMAPSWFPAAPPPSTVQLPPPSYEQVLREKTREQQQQQLVSPSPSPSPSPLTTSSLAPSPSPSHSTIATQTDVPPVPPPPQATAGNPTTRAALRRPPRPPKPPCPPKPDVDTHTPAHTSTDHLLTQQPVRPRPRPRSRADLRPISQEVAGSPPMSGESPGSGMPKSRSLSSEIVVAQPVSGERVVPQPIESERAVTPPNGPSESVCAQSEGVCLGPESVCVGGQYLQDLLDVFGPDSSHRHDAQSDGDHCGEVGEEEEAEEEEIGASPRPQPKPRRRTQTHTPIHTQGSASGSPPPPQPQPRRRSLPAATSTSQGSPQDSDGQMNPVYTGPGMPPRFLPLRPPPIKLAKPPDLIGSCSASANQQQGQRVPKRGPPLPPRPKPGHPICKSSQKENVSLMDLSDTLAGLDTNTDVCPDTPSDVNALADGPALVNTPVNAYTHAHTHTDVQTQSNEARNSDGTSLEIPSLQSNSIILTEKSTTSAMCCVAIFAFGGEEKDELSFSEGDVIMLTDYVNDEWGRGHLKGHSGIFPLCFTSSPQLHSKLHKVKAGQD
ncbi:vegetative cell wall protein gp1-like isoform X2 [Clupea harengus]|uniref:Vegetative cell wall protein gp1-like isoform X2 n=1 Tax=Clupea harengus TaxID=7950 RepID=A0A8M1KUP6_CLUHA|nr:vegetative cell wall protein gp1-like isoform X2 [Clupea harengus]